MKILPTGFDGLRLFESPVFRDERGFFLEVYRETAEAFEAPGLRFVQDNASQSRQGTLRGLHFQKPPHAQGKLVRALRGAIFDVGVDLRRSSPTFGQWFGTELSEDNGRALYLPPGFAHGFLVTSSDALVFYKCTEIYTPSAEGALAWNDPTVGIRWPTIPVPVSLSPKDAAAPRWSPETLAFP